MPLRRDGVGVNKINALINIYNEKINGWSNHLNNLEQVNIPLYKIQISDLKDDSYFIFKAFND